MRAMVTALLLFGLAASSVRPAAACSCLESPPEDMYAFAEVVFRGTPLSYQMIPDGENSYYKYVFQLTACWKGNVGDPGEVIEVRSLVSEAACGVFIPVGWDVLIYGNELSGVFHANLCGTFNALTPVGQEHIEWLGEPGCDTVSVDANSWGRVKALYR